MDSHLRGYSLGRPSGTTVYRYELGSRLTQVTGPGSAIAGQVAQTVDSETNLGAESFGF